MLENRRMGPWLLVAALVIVADQLTKWIVEASLPFGASVYVAPVLDLVHVRNTGAAFSFLAGAAGWQRELYIGKGGRLLPGVPQEIATLPHPSGRVSLAAPTSLGDEENFPSSSHS